MTEVNDSKNRKMLSWTEHIFALRILADIMGMIEYIKYENVAENRDLFYKMIWN